MEFDINNQLETKFQNFKNQVSNAISQVVKIDQKLQSMQITQDTGRVSRIKSETLIDPKQYAKQNAIRIRFDQPKKSTIPLFSDLNSQNKSTEIEYLISQLEDVEANITDNHNFTHDLSLITDKSESVVQEPFIEELGKTVLSNQIDESQQKPFTPLRRRPLQLSRKSQSRILKKPQDHFTIRIDSLEFQQKFSKKDDYIGLIIVYQGQLYNQSLKKLIQKDVLKFEVQWNQFLKLQNGDGMITFIFNYKNDDLKEQINIAQLQVQRINNQLQEVKINFDCYQSLKYKGTGTFKYQILE